ncbi:hypothetical protein DY000_02014494 [Brassica cretica]|uniref:Uncharacterized protein n=1 Tax=Brassica cretica TaxID=69181 RepID=A0ABQ7CTB5_BRACR|nr:hypothetical protein DY000_02014494 [Brassica cretica]
MKESRIDHISPHLGLKSANGKERRSRSAAYDFLQTRSTKTRDTCLQPEGSKQYTTRKHRYSDDKYRRYVLGITVFRGHTDENGRRKFLAGKTVRRYLLGYFRWNGPRKHFERKEVSEYSDELRPSAYSEKPLPSEYSEEVYPSGYSEEICPRNIPRKLSSEYPEGYTSLEYSQK